MSFCKSATKAIKKIWNEVTPELGKIVETITKVTGLIKALAGSPEVQAIAAIVPEGEKVTQWLDKAADEVVGVTEGTKTAAEKISEYLNTATSEQDRNKKLFALASSAAKHADIELGETEKKESVYDTAVLLRIMADKHS